MEKMTINQLPSRTWNRLGVNEATIDWDESATVVLPEESAEKTDMLIASDAAYARKRVTVQAEKGTKKSLFQTIRTAGKLHVQTELTAEERAAYIEDINHVAEALHQAFHPQKVNYGAYGDTGHHLHFHLVPKYTDEYEWGGVFAMNPQQKFLSDEEYTALIEEIKKYL